MEGYVETKPSGNGPARCNRSRDAIDDREEEGDSSFEDEAALDRLGSCLALRTTLQTYFEDARASGASVWLTLLAFEGLDAISPQSRRPAVVRALETVATDIRRLLPSPDASIVRCGDATFAIVLPDVSRGDALAFERCLRTLDRLVNERAGPFVDGARPICICVGQLDLRREHPNADHWLRATDRILALERGDVAKPNPRE